MQNLFPNCPICKSNQEYGPSVFYPLVACKSCKSEWAVYDYGLELKSTSQTGPVRDLLDKKYSFDFWKGELKPHDIAGRIFAPMDCVGGTPESVERTKGYIILRSENEILYVGEDKNHRKLGFEIPIQRFKEAVIKNRTAVGWAVAGFMPVILIPFLPDEVADAVKKILVIGYWDSVGIEQHRIFYFYEDGKSAEQLIDLLSYLKQKSGLEER